jgi:hypothetical protein
MTAQKADVLINEHASFDVGAWFVFGIFRGDPSSSLTLWTHVGLPDPIDATRTSTTNHKGFVRVYRLTSSGRLVLERYKYDRERKSDLPRQRTFYHEIRGEFYFDLRPVFFGPTVFVPFREGVVVVDRSRWWHRPQRSPIAHPGCVDDFGIAIDW